MGQAQYLVNLDDVLKGSQVCGIVVIVDLGHDDDSMWQVCSSTSDASGPFFCGRRSTVQSSNKKCPKPAVNTQFLTFLVFIFSWCAK